MLCAAGGYRFLTLNTAEGSIASVRYFLNAPLAWARVVLPDHGT
jgi:hypothetical protein